VVFSSGANALSAAQAAKLDNVSLLAADDGAGKGTSKYRVDLSK
jgi:2',3'-cyclic-nucleotide 2'-phosphodiesterase/3'-nucleotidase